jgi:hypothetical protein
MFYINQSFRDWILSPTSGGNYSDGLNRFKEIQGVKVLTLIGVVAGVWRQRVSLSIGPT